MRAYAFVLSALVWLPVKSGLLQRSPSRRLLSYSRKSPSLNPCVQMQAYYLLLTSAVKESV
ncbi:MAG TPA: hypothetical protein PKC98_16815, partial [Candidatus Melainabacteria bacterium]|nr:hypothetical protein [Candidatus Melainabacteria bacterium]